MLRNAGQFAQSADAARQTLALDPNMAEAHNCLGTALQALAQWDQAAGCYDAALERNPQLADAHFCRSLSRLRQGDLAGGFAEFEWRWKCKSYSTRRPTAPRWQGTPLDGRKILLHAEQGLGDTLNFIRYAAAVQARGGRVTVECQAALLPLLASCRGIDELVATGLAEARYDQECPLMSLPGVLRLAPEEFWTGPYLAADPELVDRSRQRLADVQGFRVGICWQGNPKHLFDCQRSFALRMLAPLAAVTGVSLISLQKGTGSEQLSSSSFAVLDLSSELDLAAPFVDTVAVMKNLDLVITADTVTAAWPAR